MELTEDGQWVALDDHNRALAEVRERTLAEALLYVPHDDECAVVYGVGSCDCYVSSEVAVCFAALEREADA